MSPESDLPDGSTAEKVADVGRAWTIASLNGTGSASSSAASFAIALRIWSKPPDRMTLLMEPIVPEGNAPSSALMLTVIGSAITASHAPPHG